MDWARTKLYNEFLSVEEDHLEREQFHQLYASICDLSNLKPAFESARQQHVATPPFFCSLSLSLL